MCPGIVVSARNSCCLLGMKFDLNSVSSNNSMSSDFRAAMPKLVKRRGGMMHPTAGTLRKYSDSGECCEFCAIGFIN